MATTIITKNGSGAPLAGDLTAGELAVDLTNKRLYSKDSGGTVIELGTTPSGISGGTIDDTVIGGTTPAAGTFTSLTATGDLTVDTNTLYVDSTNNRVGIGTSSPDSRLTVEAPTGDYAVLLTPSGDTTGAVTTSYIGFDVRSSTANGPEPAAYIGVEEASTNSVQGELVFATRQTNNNTVAPTEAMRIGSSGNVGIGTATAAGGHLQIYKNSSTGSDYGLSVRQDGTDPIARFAGNGDVERVRITNDGNVGIGETSPTTGNLVVATGSRTLGGTITARTSFDGTGWISGDVIGRFAFDAEDGSQDYTGTIESVVSQGGNYPYKTDMIFTTQLAGTRNEKMRITGDGDLLVGLTSATGFSGKMVITDGAVGGTTYLDICNGSNDNQFLKLGVANNLGIIGYDDGDGLAFGQFTNASGTGFSTEHMRIDSSGNLLVGTTSQITNEKFGVLQSTFGQFAITTQGVSDVIRIQGTQSSGTTYFNYFIYNGTPVGSITSTGSNTAFNTSSDQRLKENIVDAPAGNIDAIKVRSFDWKADGSHQTYGMVAQELINVAPEAVTQGKTENDMWAVDYSKLVPMMIKEIQDLKTEVAALKGAN